MPKYHQADGTSSFYKAQKKAYFKKAGFLSLTNINKEDFKEDFEDKMWLEDLATTYSPAP